VQELVDRIVTNVGVEPDLATRSVSIILNFLSAEAPPDVMRKVVDSIPGADIMLAAPAPKAGGLIGSVTGMLGGLVGGGMGGAMAAFTLLTDAGLDMGQVQGVTKEVVRFAREKAGDDTVDEVIGGIPGLSQFVG
jgi:hypothetical protein